MAALSAPGAVSAQGARVLPAHEPLNPAMVARSGLYHQPLEPREAGWQLTVGTEYGSVVERNLLWPDSYLYDAELLRVQLSARRELGDRAFVRVQAGVTGAYDGFADAFFERYHELIQWVMPERDTRPRNTYAARLLLTELGLDTRGERHALLPSDVRATVGLRMGDHHQTSLAITAPTAPSASVFARGVPSASLIHTVAGGHGRLAVEGAAGLGYTPAHGELAAVQRTVFHMLSGGLRLTLTPSHAVYGSVFHHSAPYRGTGFPELDGAEYSADFGYVWQSGSGRRWRFGLTEDLRRRDPGIDLVVKLSVE